MIIKEIIQIGNPILSRESDFVNDVSSKKVKSLITNLIDSVRYHDLIGIAAS